MQKYTCGDSYDPKIGVPEQGSSWQNLNGIHLESSTQKGKLCPPPHCCIWHCFGGGVPQVPLPLLGKTGDWQSTFPPPPIPFWGTDRYTHRSQIQHDLRIHSRKPSLSVSLTCNAPEANKLGWGANIAGSLDRQVSLYIYFFFLQTIAPLGRPQLS